MHFWHHICTTASVFLKTLQVSKLSYEPEKYIVHSLKAGIHVIGRVSVIKMKAIDAKHLRFAATGMRNYEAQMT